MTSPIQFADLKLLPQLLENLKRAGYTAPTPIQQQAIPHVLAGSDLVALAQTGTGKTAAFALPILQRLAAKRAHPRVIRCMVLSPTRELASQILDGFKTYGAGLGMEQEVIFGGVGEEPQRRALRRGMDILVATPGRLLALMGERIVDLRHIEVFVLDEADRMLDMGFIHDVRRVIAALPAVRQTLLFSATMPADIEDLSKRFMKAPVRVAVAPPATTVEKVEQSVFFVDQGHKRSLALHLLKDPAVKRVLLFTRTKHGANRVAETLDKHGVSAMAIHGNKSQGARERALEGFKKGQVRVLVATDIAARGIDVDGVTHVIQVDLPEVPEQYVHRIGRTARAGASGVAWAFCANDERPLLKDIERAIRMKIDVVNDHPFTAQNAGPPPPEERRPPPPGRGGRGGRGRPQGRGGHSSSRGSSSHGSGPSSAPAASTPGSASPPRGRSWSYSPGRR